MIYCPRGLAYDQYQIEGIKFASARATTLIGDEPGLGKTIQAVGYLNCNPHIESALIVCPASGRVNWPRELAKWLVNPFVQIDLINYERLSKADLSKTYDVAILDEAHYIANASAWRSRYARKIKADRKICMTGTPFSSRPKQLWHLLHWMDEARWPMSSLQEYGERFCAGYWQQFACRRVWNDNGASNMAELRELLSDIMIRRLKKDVLKELPPKRRQVYELPQVGVSKELRKEIKAAAREINKLMDRYEDDIDQMTEHLDVAWSQLAKVRKDTGLASLPTATQVIKDAIEGSGKVIVFAHHTEVIETLADNLREYSPVTFQGSTTTKNRIKAVDTFQDPESQCRVFIGQIQAAGEVITLTASSHVIFVEGSWVPGQITQCEDRAHRKGQTGSVLCQHLVMEGSLDVRMAKTCIRKQRNIDMALNAPEEE